MIFASKTPRDLNHDPMPYRVLTRLATLTDKEH